MYMSLPIPQEEYKLLVLQLRINKNVVKVQSCRQSWQMAKSV